MSTETDTSTTETSGSGIAGASGLLMLLGLWVLVTPFFWGPAQNAVAFGDFGGSWLYWSNILTGIAIMAVAGYTGYTARD